MIKHFIAILSFLLFGVSISTAGVVWETNFDSITDWASEETTSSYEDWTSTYNQDPVAVPSPFISYGAHIKPSGVTKQQHYINSDHAYSGKAYAGWYYSQSGTWNHGRLSFHLGNDGYNELYIQFKCKFQDDWQWRPYTENALGQASPAGIIHKIFRVIYDVDLDNLTGDPQDTNDYTKYTIVSWYGWGTGYTDTYPRIRTTTRNDADSSDSDDDIQYPDAKWYDIFDDLTKWVTLEFRLKMNNYPADDGIFEVWADGVKVASSSTLQYIGESGLQNAKMNFIMLADNMYNSWADGPLEQYMAIDDLVISTEYIGTDYVIGGSTPDITGCTISGGIDIQ